MYPIIGIHRLNDNWYEIIHDLGDNISISYYHWIEDFVKYINDLFEETYGK
jgi:hypothetical protein